MLQYQRSGNLDELIVEDTQNSSPRDETLRQLSLLQSPRNQNATMKKDFLKKNMSKINRERLAYENRKIKQKMKNETDMKKDLNFKMRSEVTLNDEKMKELQDKVLNRYVVLQESQLFQSQQEDKEKQMRIDFENQEKILILGEVEDDDEKYNDLMMKYNSRGGANNQTQIKSKEELIKQMYFNEYSDTFNNLDQDLSSPSIRIKSKKFNDLKTKQKKEQVMQSVGSFLNQRISDARKARQAALQMMRPDDLKNIQGQQVDFTSKFDQIALGKKEKQQFSSFGDHYGNSYGNQSNLKKIKSQILENSQESIDSTSVQEAKKTRNQLTQKGYTNDNQAISNLQAHRDQNEFSSQANNILQIPLIDSNIKQKQLTPQIQDSLTSNEINSQRPIEDIKIKFFEMDQDQQENSRQQQHVEKLTLRLSDFNENSLELDKTKPQVNSEILSIQNQPIERQFMQTPSNQLQNHQQHLLNEDSLNLQITQQKESIGNIQTLYDLNDSLDPSNQDASSRMQQRDINQAQKIKTEESKQMYKTQNKPYTHQSKSRAIIRDDKNSLIVESEKHHQDFVNKIESNLRKKNFDILRRKSCIHGQSENSSNQHKFVDQYQLIKPVMMKANNLIKDKRSQESSLTSQKRDLNEHYYEQNRRKQSIEMKYDLSEHRNFQTSRVNSNLYTDRQLKDKYDQLCQTSDLIGDTLSQTQFGQTQNGFNNQGKPLPKKGHLRASCLCEILQRKYHRRQKTNQIQKFENSENNEKYAFVPSWNNIHLIKQAITQLRQRKIRTILIYR
eukprot:403347114